MQAMQKSSAEPKYYKEIALKWKNFQLLKQGNIYAERVVSIETDDVT